jgi:hypothetical protein
MYLMYMSIPPGIFLKTIMKPAQEASIWMGESYSGNRKSGKRGRGIRQEAGHGGP